jgi:molybdopterin-guanine dinucleotide biosynthesis protein A
MLYDDLTVAILAGGNSQRFKSDKALATINKRPLISYMINIANKLSENILVVISDENQQKGLVRFIDEAKVVIDPDESIRCALTGAVTAFEYSKTQYTLLLPIDSPLAKLDLLRIIVEFAPHHGAVVPSWPSGYIEPLHSVYLSEHAYHHGLRMIEAKKYRMKNLLDALANVLYVSTTVLTQFDPDLATFTNINTEKDLIEIEKKFSVDFRALHAHI